LQLHQQEASTALGDGARRSIKKHLRQVALFLSALSALSAQTFSEAYFSEFAD